MCAHLEGRTFVEPDQQQLFKAFHRGNNVGTHPARDLACALSRPNDGLADAGCSANFHGTTTNTEIFMKGAGTKKELTPRDCETLLKTLKARFEKNMGRHKGLDWARVQAKLEARADKLWSLNEMEKTGGEPDVVGQDVKSGEYLFYDCSPESPKGRTSVCYDREALDSRKEHKPKTSAMEMAAAMGVELLTEDQYHALQQLGNFDMKSSSWLAAPAEVRKLGGALFGDRRFGRVFIYHNGAQSYYSGRGFRGALRV